MTRPPTRGYVYRLFDTSGALLYVGHSARPAARFAEHAQTKAWWPDVTRITITAHPDLATARLAEKTAIRDELPAHNTTRYGPDLRATRTPPRDPAATAVEHLQRLGDEMRAADAELKAAIREEVTAGRCSEAAASRAAGVDRRTVRRALGKSDR